MKLFDSYDGDPEDDAENIKCKNCGQNGLEWTHTGTRWRLVDDKGLHTCKATADDFDVVDGG